MSGRIFINYRREDSQHPAGRLYDQLEREFGKQSIFIDVDHIAAGADFVQVLHSQVSQCDVMLSIIGRNWLGITDQTTGRRRLDNPGDFVRIEIEAALARNIIVVPVLVDGADMPAAQFLPDSLKPLATRNAVRLTHDRFRFDSAGLIKSIKQALAATMAYKKATRSKKYLPFKPLLAGVAVIALLAAGVVMYMNMPERQTVVVVEKEAAPNKTNQTLRAIEHDRFTPGTIFDDCNGAGWCPSMVVVPKGSFMMGSKKGDKNEKHVRRVTFDRPFSVGRFEVTFKEWDACVAGGGCKHKPSDLGWARGKRPVMTVSWKDVKTYLKWLKKKTGKKYRLLSEAEWEYVARAGSASKYFWGDSIGRNKANCDGCGSKWDNNKTAPVGSFDANTFKVHDMHGNVWEWVEDCYNDSYKGAPTDGSARKAAGSCDDRVLRGGSGIVDPSDIRSAFRIGYTPDYRSIFNGFRVARSLP